MIKGGATRFGSVGSIWLLRRTGVSLAAFAGGRWGRSGVPWWLAAQMGCCKYLRVKGRRGRLSITQGKTFDLEPLLSWSCNWRFYTIILSQLCPVHMIEKSHKYELDILILYLNWWHINIRHSHKITPFQDVYFFSRIVVAKNEPRKKLISFIVFHFLSVCCFSLDKTRNTLRIDWGHEYLSV